MNSVLEITTAELSTPNGRRALEAVMAIQRSHVLQAEQQDGSRGFVITVWKEGEWLRLLQTGSRLFVLTGVDGTVQAYTLIAPASEFVQILTEGRYKLEVDFGAVAAEDWRYLYQVSVARGVQGQRLGEALVREAMARAGARRFVSDYLIEPHLNRASQKFCERLGFRPIGRLELESYRGFAPTTWQVVAT